jgi:hypothetical protein
MPSIRKSRETNFTPNPQIRLKGTGAGRKLFPWKRDYPWLVIAAEQLFVVQSGSGDALLEDRHWVLNWNLSADCLKDELESLFPGISDYMDKAWDWKTPWPLLLKNRVYKMYYSGTSDRGTEHDPLTRATVSREHWRYWPCRTDWEEKILSIVSRRIRFKGWRLWV